MSYRYYPNIKRAREQTERLLQAARRKEIYGVAMHIRDAEMASEIIRWRERRAKVKK